MDSLDMTAAPHPRFFFSAGPHTEHLPTPVEICCYIIGMGLEGRKQASKERNQLFLCYSEPSKSFSTSTQKECYKMPITPPKASSIQYHHDDSSSETPIVAFFQLPTNSSSSSPYCGSLEDLIHLQEKNSPPISLCNNVYVLDPKDDNKNRNPKTPSEHDPDVNHFLRSHGDEFWTFFFFFFFPCWHWIEQLA
jgi:hypothetical protein